MIAIRFATRLELAIRRLMSRHSAGAPDRASTLFLWFLIAFLTILWGAGGASRADVLGQAVVRFSAWSIIVMAIFALPRVDWRAVKGPAIILGATSLLVMLQLVPLPPSIWTELPGREIFAEAAVSTGADQPWRPLSISPSGTANALASLIVPAVVLFLGANLTREQHWTIAIVILALVGGGTLLGILQFSGASFDNPLINEVPGEVAGNFANRNHFALFLAVGCVISVAWAFRAYAKRWKVYVAFGALALFHLTVLATGSRSGIAIAMIATVFVGLAISRRMVQQLKALPHKIAASFVVIGIAVFASAIWLSISLDRATSIDRAASVQNDADLRWQIWPVVLDMFQRYFPAGSGLGAFDPVYRISEPDLLLQSSYINLAHNDWLQILLEGGLLGVTLLAIALAWFIGASTQVWIRSTDAGSRRLLGKVGSIVIVLILAASVTDYPARTPMVMALLALAATWLPPCCH